MEFSSYLLMTLQMVQCCEQLPSVQLHVEVVPLGGQFVDDFLQRLMNKREDQCVRDDVGLNFVDFKFYFTNEPRMNVPPACCTASK